MKDFSYNLPDLKSCRIAVIGLGYVGLPLAYEFSKLKKEDKTYLFEIIGFDINNKRILELKSGIDKTKEVDQFKLTNLKNIRFTSNVIDLENADVFIVTVPTPLKASNQPDFLALLSASKTVGRALKQRKGKRNSVPVVIYESTVYPGATEEVCLPVIIEESGMNLFKKGNSDCFALGYSPERINPGDKKHKLSDIKKVTSGACKESAIWINKLYKTVIKAGTFEAKSIKIAEASKVIENVQRDLNIAIVNEFSLIFSKLDIDTLDVLEAAETKWNFLPFKPGLVGGHCIGVDPYYLTFKSKQMGYYPDLILSGRNLNNGMGVWIIEKIILEMVSRSLDFKKAKILFLGVTFKENCPDIRNSQIINMINAIKKYDINVDVVDPHVDDNDFARENKLKLVNKLFFDRKYDVVIVCVAHKEFRDINKKQWKVLIKEKGFIFDIKGIVPRSLNPIRL